MITSFTIESYMCKRVIDAVKNECNHIRVRNVRTHRIDKCLNKNTVAAISDLMVNDRYSSSSSDGNEFLYFFADFSMTFRLKRRIHNVLFTIQKKWQTRPQMFMGWHVEYPRDLLLHYENHIFIEFGVPVSEIRYRNVHNTHQYACVPEVGPDFKWDYRNQ